MKKIEFKHSASQKIYQDYIQRVKSTTKTLSKEDSTEILMEINSHIFEGTRGVADESEIDNLLAVVGKLGAPEEVLKPLVADKKMEQATKTFNPLHVLQALVLNIGNGISFIIFSILYLFLGTGIFLVFAKLFNPSVGMYYKEDQFVVLGYARGINASEMDEVLGNWFIPVMIASVVILYFIITLLLKLKRALKK